MTKDDAEGVSRPSLKGKKFGTALHGHSEASRQNLSEIAKTRGWGGYKPGSGRGKRGWFQGIHCDSSWELAFLLHARDHGKSVVRNRSKRHYEFEGKARTYTPDFIVDGEIVEIKGFRSAQWEAKQRYNPDVKVLDKEGMQPILDYVTRKYGNDFIRLYEIK